ncbi:ribosomal RNA small subunit methyltransferase A [Candidatus Nitrosarchaeum limnium]|jgi:16S rRNA (adenine1518-N6/adenine1519-N6)-dimethyltransferase|uniref:Ribosomal RNA adenine dimethylase family protein n=1 Tax=Candidatus Nitrosarchaeum limnium BG20 TaxID=859192 RepID=S2EQ92_9ARCH|nr:rRNA adenine dimethyltransferase family protein [Candidatus Nitrosarchaeum limnium]EPA06592.1 ribosomal RNA adenine dimethylase family protein [Candidatus Nitrosarchaeum limnium BG20]
MIKRKRLGQHFLTSNSIAQSIVSEANISGNDIVFELGTGLGILTPLLCEKAKKVISIDADRELYENAKSRFSHIDNLTVEFGDGFQKQDKFSIFVSNLPYSKSKEAIEWLAITPFSHGVIMVQKEFAEKLLTKSTKNRRSVSIITNYVFEIEKFLNVGKNNFSPPPKVDSVVLKITKKKSIEKDLINVLNKMFSYRRKTIQNIFKQFGKETLMDKRLDDLSGDEIIDLAKEILER